VPASNLSSLPAEARPASRVNIKDIARTKHKTILIFIKSSFDLFGCLVYAVDYQKQPVVVLQIISWVSEAY
jgi:hypothetical protein